MAIHKASLSFTISGGFQTHVHWVDDSIQPSYPLSSPSPPSLNLSIIRVFSNELALHFKCQSIETSCSASVLPMNIQGWFSLGLVILGKANLLVSLLSKELSRVLSITTVQKHQLFGAQPSLWSNSHIHRWLLEKPQLWLCRPLLAR